MKRKILFLSNFCLANSGFGKYQKNLLSRLYKTGKYEIAELGAGVSEADPISGTPNPELSKLPWRVYGALPKNQDELHRFNSADENLKRAYAYGLFRFDEAVIDFKPDIVVCHEDMWAWQGWLKHVKTYGKFVPVAFHPFDAEPMTEEFAVFLKDLKYVFTYGKWSQEIGFKANLPQTQIATLGVDLDVFKPIDGLTTYGLRAKFGLQSSYVVTMVARNQVRKKFDALFESLNHIKRISPELYAKIKILPFTNYTDAPGINFPKFWKSREIDVSKIVTPYICGTCNNYHIADKYEGEDKACPFCQQKTCHTPSVVHGFSDQQLNEVYATSDLFVLATSNEGFGMILTEALAAGKMILTTDYATGAELAKNSGAGFLIPCVQYIEHGTMFYKAHVTPGEIAKQINKIYGLKPQTRKEMEIKGREYVVREHGYEKLAKDWEERFDNMELLQNVSWDFSVAAKNPNPNAELPQFSNEIEWLVGMYKSILDTDIVKETNGNPAAHQGVQYWLMELQQGRRSQQDIEAFFRQTANEEAKKKVVDLRSLLDENDTKRILWVMPQSCGDNFLSTAVVKAIKRKYPTHSIYVASKPEFADVWKNNPDIKRWLPFIDSMLVYGAMESRFTKGVFDICYTPTILTQMNCPNWNHNGEDDL